MPTNSNPLITIVCIGNFGKRLIEKLRAENLGGISQYLHLERFPQSPDGVMTINKLSEAFVQLDTVLIIDFLTGNSNDKWLATQIAERAKELKVRPILTFVHPMVMHAIIAKIKERYSNPHEDNNQ